MECGRGTERVGISAEVADEKVLLDITGESTRAVKPRLVGGDVQGQTLP